MSAPKITIEHCKTELKSTEPHLMPFHIAHTGPAPISTYFRIKPATSPFPEPSQAPLPAPLASHGSMSSDKENSDAVMREVEEEPQSQATASSSTAMPSATPALEVAATVTATQEAAESSSAPSRFVSAFRGRAVHGLSVALPAGYGGLVLQGDVETSQHGETDAMEASKSTRKGKGRRATRSKAAVAEEEDEDAGMEVDEDDAPRTRILRPTARFDSFTLWHPDIPPDVGQDTYVRSLTEWVSLAAEIHRVES